MPALASAQLGDPEYLAVKTSCTSLEWKEVKLGASKKLLLCDVSLNVPRPWVPLPWRRRVFAAVHGLAHVGYRPTLKAVSDRFVWFGMKKDLKLWCRECLDCQASKVSRHVRAPLEHLAPPDDRFEHIHVDLVGPLPSSEGHTYLFTILDRFSRWPEALPPVSYTHLTLPTILRV